MVNISKMDRKDVMAVAHGGKRFYAEANTLPPACFKDCPVFLVHIPRIEAAIADIIERLDNLPPGVGGTGP